MRFNPNDPLTWNVVICDDEPDSIGVVEFVFNFHGARVRSADSGERCLEVVRADLPDLLFLDIQMPGMSGWEVLSEIRAIQALKGIVVIAMTAKAMAGDRERALAADFDAYFSKPLAPTTLIQNVTDILQKHAQLHPRPDTELPASPPPL